LLQPAGPCKLIRSYTRSRPAVVVRPQDIRSAQCRRSSPSPPRTMPSCPDNENQRTARNACPFSNQDQAGACRLHRTSELRRVEMSTEPFKCQLGRDCRQPATPRNARSFINQTNATGVVLPEKIGNGPPIRSLSEERCQLPTVRAANITPSSDRDQCVCPRRPDNRRAAVSVGAR